MRTPPGAPPLPGALMGVSALIVVPPDEPAEPGRVRLDALRHMAVPVSRHALVVSVPLEPEEPPSLFSFLGSRGRAVVVRSARHVPVIAFHEEPDPGSITWTGRGRPAAASPPIGRERQILIAGNS